MKKRKIPRSGEGKRKRGEVWPERGVREGGKGECPVGGIPGKEKKSTGGKTSWFIEKK